MHFATVILEEWLWLQVPMYSIQRDSEYWPEPVAFQPERFMPGPDGRSPADAAPHGAWMPFGDGTRSCIGMRFAKQEAHITLARLFQRCGVYTGLASSSGQVTALQVFRNTGQTLYEPSPACVMVFEA